MAALTQVSAGQARALLDRLLDLPSPRALAQRLAPEIVVRWLERVGLEDAGDVVALLSADQLEQVLDHDLWRAQRPGHDEQFDGERFALWLRVLVEHSPALAASKLRALDFELVALGLCKQLIVLDMDQLARQLAHARHTDDDEQLEKLLETRLHHELEQYRLVARDASSFEALLAIVLELDAHDYTYLSALLERCCVISSDYVEENGGLYELLSAEQTIEADVAGEREQRREQRGFVPPSSALAFLRLTLETPAADLLASRGPDALTRAHFRASLPSPSRAPSRATGSAAPRSLPAEHEQAAEAHWLSELEALLQDAPPARLAPGRGRRTPLAHALDQLAAVEAHGSARAQGLDTAAYERCIHEAAYLANVLLAGVGTSAQRLTPEQALRAAHALGELGAAELARARQATGAARVAALRAELAHEAGLVKLFRIGFQRLLAPEAQAATAKRPLLGALRQLLRAQGLETSRRALRP